MAKDSSILFTLPTSRLVASSVVQFDRPVVLTGTDGADTLVGRGGSDTIYGGDGNDVLRGLDGWDDLYGGGGDDVLWGLDGLDDLYAGPGGNCTMYGGAYEDELYAGAGLDVLYGGTHDDQFVSMQNTSGRDTIFGGDGSDTIDYGNWSDGVFVDLRRVSSSESISPDVIYGVENVDGSEQNDTIVGNTANNYLSGGSGDDRLIGLSGDDRFGGGAGNDNLFGGTGKDKLFGGYGDDVIHGGRGADTMDGGIGEDQFVFNVQTDIGGGNDRIWMFDGNEDRLLISGLAAGSEAPDVSIFVRPTGVSMVTVGDPADPLFVIAVEDYYGAITLGDIEFAFLG